MMPYYGNPGINYYREQPQVPDQQIVQLEPHTTTLIEPFIYHALLAMNYSSVTVETNKGTIRGLLTDVKPDHIVLDVSDQLYFIRLQEITWIMPTQKPAIPAKDQYS
ncbi:YuzF family protein [Alkalibacillus aidingensis]|uniref:YuzF family protein n=1 Tax=Alkalibacillus aidingensis TaxID=2747607 RepID=UPI001CB6D23E|nr:YuzF family protein [Alkalibacillus aidingensis]